MSRSFLLVSLFAVGACSAGSPPPGPPHGAASAAPPSPAPSVAMAPTSTAVATAAPSGSPSSSTAASLDPDAVDPPPRSPIQVTKAMCRCYLWSLTGTAKPDPDPCSDGTRESVEETFVEECVRAHDPVKDCPGLIACVNLEPSGYAECAKGEEFSPTSTCGSCRCAPADGKP